MSTKALVPLAEGFEEIEALTVVDVLRRGGVEVVMAALDGASSVKGAHGVTVMSDAPFAEAEKGVFDVLVLPGGPGTQNLAKSELLIGRLRRQKEDGGLIAAICAAPTVLVAAEVLEPDQHVTCYPTCVMDLDRKSAGVPVVADGNVITGQAPGAAMLFGLVVLAHLEGERVAHGVANGLVTNFE